MKKCPRCSKRRRAYAGRICKSCRNRQVVAQRRARRARDPKWHAQEKKRDAARAMVRYRAMRPAARVVLLAANRERARLHQRRWSLRKLYGLDLHAFEALFAEQGQCCAICCSESPLGKGWCVDHCHRTGRIRGVLCNACNRGMGLLRDSADQCRKAAEYLDSHS